MIGMSKILAIAALVLGAVLLFYGINEKNSFGSRVKEVFTGSPTDHSTLLIATGAACAAIGVGLFVFGKKS